MRSSLVYGALFAFAAAQDLDWDVVTDLDPQPTPSIPVVYATSGSAIATAVTLTYSESAILAAVSSALQADPSDAAPLDNSVNKRDTVTTSCKAQPTGAGPVPSPDSPSAFISYTVLANSASAAPVPSGYVQTFKNLQASNNAFGYLGYTTLTKYDTQACAKQVHEDRWVPIVQSVF